jgi:CRISPR/Cas system CSM-associated protein Csm3 (group 7 of RAMP superfamily)
MKIAIEFFSYWHCGSGSSGGSRVDALVAKDANGLPYIAGKTIKGHIREMAESLNNKKFINLCFGSSEEREGKCYFSNATIEEKIDKNLISYLFTTISSTKIDDKGLAIDGSLREIEVVVPLKLFATIEFEDEVKKFEDEMKKALLQVKRMGLNRTRGLGRCEITVVGESND